MNARACRVQDAAFSTNRLLSAAPAQVMAALRPYLETVPITAGQVLHEPCRPLVHAWLPLRGVVSLLTPMGDGKHVEAVDVGPEGMVGLSFALGAETAPNLAVVRVPGEAARVAAGPFRDVLDHCPGLRRLFARYALVRMAHGARMGACARTHAVEGRLASRLLAVHDGVHGAARFPLTHETMAEMLGVHRPTVSAAAARLQHAGLIAYVRGLVTVLDRPGLDAASCGCHRVVAAGFDRLAGGGD